VLPIRSRIDINVPQKEITVYFYTNKWRIKQGLQQSRII
jgi:hypothetical protein